MFVGVGFKYDNLLLVYGNNSGLKIPKQYNFGTKFKVFLFWIKLGNSTNSRVLISNMTILL